MKEFMELFRNVFRFHKFKIFMVFCFAALFALMLFPFGDLSDLVSAKVSEATGGQVYLQFDDMSLSLGSGLGLDMENVRVETATLPPIRAANISIFPWLTGALAAKQGVAIDASGIFNGQAFVDFRQGDKLNSGERSQKIEITTDKVSLPALSQFLREGNISLPDLQGLLNITSNVTVDPLFDQQPKGSIGVDVTNFRLPGQTISVPFNGVNMPIPLPEFDLGRTALKANVGDGQLDVQDFSFGGAKSPLSGKISGLLGLSFQRGNSGVRPQVGKYDLKIELTMSRDFYEQNRSSSLGAVLGFIDQFKQETPQGVRFAFRAKGDPNAGMPTLTRAQ